MRPADGGLADLPLRGQLLHDRDALHPVRHRGGLPVPGGGDPRGGELGLRPGRDRDLRRSAAGRPGVRVAKGSARLEVRREKLRALSPLEEPRSPAEFRARLLRARDLLRGDLEGAALDRHVADAVLTTTLDKTMRWGRANLVFPATFGLACCAIEMM